ncbi:hypothetical protein B9T16_29075, partial [Arthrospira sp. PCC 8006]|uniref:fibrobacter succinogenes major paralogous domain-containing protein n=1 Tax=Arthrospira sp. PCC 8006 TaxID=1982224 RepID=UPI00396E6777
RLYNWGAVNTGKLCPTGWHIPTSEEWDELIDYLGGENEAGGKMKTTTGWSAPNEGATNESNFSALPAGYRYFNFGGFMEMFETTQFWTSTPSSRNNYFNNVYLHNWSEKAFTFYARPNSGFSCRCIKD